MRKLYLLTAAFAMVACHSLYEGNDQEAQVEEEGIVPPAVTAIQESSTPTPKSVLETDGDGKGTIYWKPADEINVFYGTTSTHYTSQNTENATSAVFKTTDVIGISEGSSTNIWGLYPYDENATCDGSSVTTTLPATQYGVPGTFDDDLFITLAHNTSTALEFFNVCGGIKFSLSRDDITSITFRGNNNEDIAGDISLDFVDDLPNASVTSGVKTITITPKTGATFAAGQYYYIVIRPITLSNGFTMTFETDSEIGTFNYSSSAITIKRSIFGKKDEIDSYAEFVAQQQRNVIYYTSTDGSVVSPSTFNPFDDPVEKFDATIVSNTYTDDMGVITFDNDITEVRRFAFYSSSIHTPNKLQSIILPDGVKTIGGSVFENCTTLQTIVLPKSLTTIGAEAFYYCTNLQSLTLPKGLTDIGPTAFYRCTSLQSIDLPDGITSISARAFSTCTALQSINLPKGLTTIGAAAFYNCTSLQSIDLPESVTTLLVQSTFECCSSLQSISLPSGVTSVPPACFYGCTSLQSVSLPGGITSIEQNLFDGCAALSSISIPEGVTTIGLRAFFGCASLQEITIPENVETIDTWAFKGCEKLHSVYVLAEEPPTPLNYDPERLWFEGTSSLLQIYVPAGSVDSYKAAPGWSDYADKIYAIQE